MQQETNIYEIAREAGVSIATVSRVINNSGSVSEKSRKKVSDAIQKLNYVPNGNARSLSKSTSTTIGVIIPDINNPFFSQLLKGITLAADEHGLHISLFNTDEDREREHQILISMREQRLCGIIATPVSETDPVTIERLLNFENLGIPVVLLDRELSSQAFDSVVTDDANGVYHAVSELIRVGHKRIAIITGPDDSRPGHERLEGYRRAMLDHGLPLLPELILPGNFMVERAYELTKSVFQLPDPPTAIFSSNNMTTYGCLRAFSELQLQLGKDISLIGFDDIDALGWLNFPVSVVSRDVPEMGEQAMRLLLQRFDSDGKSTSRRNCLPTELILRGSEKLPSLGQKHHDVK